MFRRQIKTERLVLRVPELRDACAVFDYARDPEVTRFMLWAAHRHIRDTQQFLEDCIGWWSDGRDFPYVIERRDTGMAIGMTGIHPKADFMVELGYVLARPHWGNGFATEAVRAVTAEAFTQRAIVRVQAECHVDNAASVRVLEKAGFEFEGIRRKSMLMPRFERPVDVRMYAKVR